MVKTDLTVKIGKLTLKNPVLVASGTFGYGEEFHQSIFDISRLGAVITKGISLKPRQGNDTPRIVETSFGMLNSIGLANVGIENFLKDKIPFLENTGATIIVNIFGEKPCEYAELAKILNRTKSVSAIEVNISCPNVKQGGLSFGGDPKSAAAVTEAVKKQFDRTVIVKLSPQVTSIVKIAKAVSAAGADAVSLINTFPAMAIDVATRRPKLANIVGGLSGPAIKPIALKMVYDVAKNLDVPIIGIGGIMTLEDSLEFIFAGAHAVEIGTANFVKPSTAVDIIDGLGRYCVENGYGNVSDLVGTVNSEQ